MKIRRLLLPAALAGTCLLSLGACALSLASLFVLMSKHRESPESASFHWSQIESSDSTRYAENLRAVGCPAPTIQAILGQTESRNSPSAPTASAQAEASPTPATQQSQTFAERRATAMAAQAQRQADAQSYAAASNPAPSYTEPAQAVPASATTTDVSNTESSPEPLNSTAGYAGTSALAAYAQGGVSGSAGSSSTIGYAAAGNAPAAPVQTIVAPDANSQIPAAFSDTPPSANPTAQQTHQLDGIQRQFADSVSQANSSAGGTPSGGGGNSESTPPIANSASTTTPANPKKAWQNAAWLADQQYRAQFGTRAFLQHQNQALHSSSSQ